MRSGRLLGDGGRWGRATGHLLLGSLLFLPGAALASPAEPQAEVGFHAGRAGRPEAAPEAAAVEESGSRAPAPEPERPPGEDGWVDQGRLAVERSLGELIQRFDRFFGDVRRLDAEAPVNRLRLKSFGRFTDDGHVTLGGAVSASIHLPHLDHRLGDARLVLVGENTSDGAPVPLSGDTPQDGETMCGSPVEAVSGGLARSRARAELRVDLLRGRMAVIDASGGLTFSWPAIPFARLRGHLRLGLPGGLVLRGTQGFLVELGPRGAGTSTDLLVERFVSTVLRLRWEGHGLFAWHTRGIAWNTLVVAEWRVHPRTGLYAGVGANGFGTPAPGLDAWRTWTGVRQDLWRGWIFAELEPQVAWPRLPGQPRNQVLGVTLRLELVLEARPSTEGADG